MSSDSGSSSGVNTVAIVLIFAVLIVVGAWFVLGRGTAPTPAPQQAPAPGYNGGNAPAPVNPPGGGDNPAPQPPPSNP